MSDTLVLAAIAIGGIGLIVFSMSNKSLLNTITPDEEIRIQQSLGKPGSVPDAGNCTRSSECSGGTNWGTFGNTSICVEGKCAPMVLRDDGTDILWNPKQINLKKACGKFVLLGDGGKCSDTAQCGTSYETTWAGDSSNKSATVSSKTYCGPRGVCAAKGKNPLNVWYEAEHGIGDLKYDIGVVDGGYIRKNKEFAKKSGCQELMLLS